MSMPAAITFENVTLGYGRRPAVHHLEGEIAAGSLTAIVGPNGAGKSTLLKGVMGTLRPLEGSIVIPGASSKRIAYLPQASDIDRTFPISVYDIVSMGLWSRSGLFGGIGRKDRARIGEALMAVGLSGFEKRSISSLSGGQMQRVLFARLLLQDASVILLDEPFNAIDAKTQADLLGVIRRWHDESRTVVAVLHDMDVVRRVFPETLLVAREPIAWGETGSVLNAENLLKARRMVEAHDELAATCAAAA